MRHYLFVCLSLLIINSYPVYSQGDNSKFELSVGGGLAHFTTGDVQGFKASASLNYRFKKWYVGVSPELAHQSYNLGVIGPTNIVALNTDFGFTEDDYKEFEGANLLEGLVNLQGNNVSTFYKTLYLEGGVELAKFNKHSFLLSTGIGVSIHEKNAILYVATVTVSEYLPNPEPIDLNMVVPIYMRYLDIAINGGLSYRYAVSERMALGAIAEFDSFRASKDRLYNLSLFLMSKF